MMINEKLTPYERATALRRAGVKIKNNYGQANGLKNPAYNDTNGSLSINLNNGMVQDFGNDVYTGDVVTLIGKIINRDFKDTLAFIEGAIGRSLSNYKGQSDYTKQGELLYSPPKEEKKEKSVTFWDSKNWEKMKICMNVLEKRGIPDQMKYIEDYDGINLEILKKMHCGIYGFKDYEFGLSGANYNNSVYFVFPYESGAMLYRREDGEKEIKHIKGSDVKKSFFNTNKEDKKTGILFIMKSPRECMSMHRYISGVNGIKVIGIVSGESIKEITQNQKKQLDRYIKDGSTLIYIFNDCDNPDSYETSYFFSKIINEYLHGKAATHLVNIHKRFKGKFKDFTDIIQFSMKKKSWVEVNGFMQIEEECEEKLLTEISTSNTIQ